MVRKGKIYLSKYIVEKSPPLQGGVRIGGSKNSVLPILAATLLTDELCTISDVPALKDVLVMQEMLEDFGVKVGWSGKEKIDVHAKKISKTEASFDLVRQIRASFLVMGPMLARTGKIKIPLPGGCAIGTRPVDLHLKGFSALGANINQEHGFVIAKAKKLKAAKIYLDFPSVGATENIMMAAVLAEGQTVIQNPASEPEIVDLANFLNEMGADVRGAGTDSIKINGVEKLHGASHTVIPDRIEAGTFMVAAAISKGQITIDNVVIDHLKPIIAKLKETGVEITEIDNGLKVAGGKKIKAMDVKTLPYPGFPTDMQAPFMALLTLSEGTSLVIETVFENRFMHVSEFVRMGADIKIDGRSAVIEGVQKLTGSQVRATDLRAGAALIVCALVAEGRTEIDDAFHVTRGYYNIDEKLRSLGAKIEYVSE